MPAAPTLPATITMPLSSYSTLVALARVGAKDRVSLEEFLVTIEKANNITRYLLWVQWQELDAPLPPHTSFPTVWPPNLRRIIETINAPVSQTDVNTVLAQYATNPTNVMVTPDPAAILGWTTVEAYFSR